MKLNKIFVEVSRLTDQAPVASKLFSIIFSLLHKHIIIQTNGNQF